MCYTLKSNAMDCFSLNLISFIMFMKVYIEIALSIFVYIIVKLGLLLTVVCILYHRLFPSMYTSTSDIKSSCLCQGSPQSANLRSRADWNIMWSYQDCSFIPILKLHAYLFIYLQLIHNTRRQIMNQLTSYIKPEYINMNIMMKRLIK